MSSGTRPGASDAQSLHRIEPAFAREEVEAAGFVLDAESTMLANEDEPHSIRCLIRRSRARLIASPIGL